MGKSCVNPFLAAFLFGAASCAAGEPSGATSLYLAIQNGRGLGVPDELRLTASGEGGAFVSEQRLPPSGPLVPPGTGLMLGTVTLYFGTASEVRVDVHGYVGGVMKSAGTIQVSSIRDRQIPAQLVLAPAARENSDAAPDAGQDAAGLEASVDGARDAVTPETVPGDAPADRAGVDAVIDAVPADASPMREQ